jgi:hypothetical protein
MPGSPLLILNQLPPFLICDDIKGFPKVNDILNVVFALPPSMHYEFLFVTLYPFASMAKKMKNTIQTRESLFLSLGQLLLRRVL